MTDNREINMARPKVIKYAGRTIPVVWVNFSAGNPETCSSTTYGVVFPEGSTYGLKIFINTLYPEEQQRSTLLSELWHVVQFTLNIEKYNHNNMHIIVENIWAMVQTNKWLKTYIWGK